MKKIRETCRPNISIGSLPTLQISLGIFAFFEKIYDGEPILAVNLKYRGGCTIPLLQIGVWCEKFATARHDADIGIQWLFTNNKNRVRGAVLGLSQDGPCSDLFENLRENSIEWYHFSHWSIPELAYKIRGCFFLCWLNPARIASDKCKTWALSER
jgi:hypothetical protein